MQIKSATAYLGIQSGTASCCANKIQGLEHLPSAMAQGARPNGDR
ncbi:hypothetical protein [Brasilonema sp. UFV-L1]|nr:hypothetical protein [Brasilonema sp. UFV-L1]